MYYVRFRRFREFRASIREERGQKWAPLAAAASKKGASGTLSPTSRCRARARAAGLFGSLATKAAWFKVPRMCTRTRTGPSCTHSLFVRGELHRGRVQNRIFFRVSFSFILISNFRVSQIFQNSAHFKSFNLLHHKKDERLFCKRKSEIIFSNNDILWFDTI